MIKDILACTNRRLLKGQVKSGKTYGELIRMYETGKNYFSIIVTINQIASRDQTKKQALEIGFAKNDIIFAKELCLKNNRYGSLAGKLCIVNLNEAYDARITDIITEAHSQNLKVNYTADEYDANAVMLRIKSPMVRHLIERRWITALAVDDIITFVSATNAVAFFSNLQFTEIKEIRPWNKNYKGVNDIIIKTMDDIMADELEKGIIGSSLINLIKRENNSSKKALLKITNLVNWNQDNDLTHQHLHQQFLDVGIKAVVMNSTTHLDVESAEYKAAVVVIVGQMANRTQDFPDIFSQYINFGETLPDASIIQALRLCGARAYTPILYIPQSKEPRLRAAIKQENDFRENLDWNNRGPIDIDKNSIPLPHKIDGQKRENKKIKPTYIISEEEYMGVIVADYPMIDDINRAETKGTRKYGDKDVNYIVESLINTWSKDRVQPTRKLVIPNNKGVIVKKGIIATSIRMGLHYENSMTQFAAYYIDPQTFEIKIALWKVDPNADTKDTFYVTTENRAAA